MSLWPSECSHGCHQTYGQQAGWGCRLLLALLIVVGSPTVAASTGDNHDRIMQLFDLPVPPPQSQQLKSDDDTPSISIAGSTSTLVRLQQHGATWWFASSAASLFVSSGVDHVMFSGDNFGAKAGGAEYERSVQRMFGGNRTAWAETAVRRIAKANFNTLGSWSSSTCPDCWQTDGEAQAAAQRHHLFYSPIIDFTVLYNRRFNTTGFPDVFDPKFNASARDFARDACAPRATDPLVLGYFLDNEDSCPPYPEVALEGFLRMAADSPGFAVAVAHRGSIESFAALVAKQYFLITTAAVRAFDPGHLILGCKIPCSWAVQSHVGATSALDAT